VAKKQSRTASAGTPALAALVEARIPHEVHAYDHDEATFSDIGYGLEAAHALGVEPERVFKTLMVETSQGHVLGVVPVTTQLDLKALAKALGEKKVALAGPEVAERISGSVVGGISPLGGRTRLSIVLDESAELFDTIYVSAGKRGLDVELAPGDLLLLTAGVVADIAVG
jgi:Cys-tRNA(Pro)/Cys-tRNA(Cys) deacylase